MQFVKDLFAIENQEFKLLFVEDNIVNREYILEILKHKFPNIITAENGEQGLELFSKHRPDLVITDIRMPALDGISMAEKLKEIDPELPIIIVSAFGDREELMKSIRTGITRFILKPVNNKELLAIVEELINLIRLRRKVKLQQQFIETILNSQKVITILTDGHELLGANHAALSFVGFDSLANLREKHKRYCDFFLDGDDCLASNEDWLSLLKNMPNQ
ncbi:MAG: response regulator, partial [Leptonema sp. (in: Bacteria)]|nr:response regulator [Leptonema sp. (in: bacteria)]